MAGLNFSSLSTKFRKNKKYSYSDKKLALFSIFLLKSIESIIPSNNYVNSCQFPFKYNFLYINLYKKNIK